MSNPFGAAVDVPMKRFGAPGLYRMRSIDAGAWLSDEDISDIVRICSEPLLWRFLFRDRLGGRTRYLEEDAQGFIDWARAGWESGAHMAFLLRDGGERICACVDVGGPDESGEALIGYWSSAFHRGVMTSALLSLGSLAKDAGYLKLLALVEPENARSSAVLRRAGFSHLGSQEAPVTFFDRPVGKVLRYLRYERAL